MISIGTIGLIKAVNTFKADKGIRLATYASRCIENEILMYFRRTKKLQGEVSLNEAIETDGDGAELSIGDVVGKSDTMLEDLQDKDDRALVRRLVAERLTEREADVIRRRYGLEGRVPQTQRQVAAAYKISRSYVSRIEKKGAGKAGGGAAGVLVRKNGDGQRPSPFFASYQPRMAVRPRMICNSAKASSSTPAILRDFCFWAM